MSTDVLEVRRALDAQVPFRLLDVLGIKHRREGRAARLCCPFHTERTPSATLRIGPEGSGQLHCHGACGRSWDTIALVAQVHGLDTRGSDFARVLEVAAGIAGISLSPDLFAGSAGFRRDRVVSQPKTPPPASVPVYPPDAFDWWARCLPVTSDTAVTSYLAGRALDPARVSHLDLARVLPPSGALPPWARFAGRSWRDTGHVLVTPAYDAVGALRSVRASRVVEGDTPKRLAPSGHTCAGLVFANPIARVVLSNPDGAAEDIRRAFGEVRILVVEGEPDTWTAATSWGDWAVIGVFSGAWSTDVAARIPDGSKILVRTHDDEAGRRYADEIRASLEGRCDLR